MHSKLAIILGESILSSLTKNKYKFWLFILFQVLKIGDKSTQDFCRLVGRLWKTKNSKGNPFQPCTFFTIKGHLIMNAPKLCIQKCARWSIFLYWKFKVRAPCVSNNAIFSLERLDNALEFCDYSLEQPMTSKTDPESNKSRVGTWWITSDGLRFYI